MNLPIRSGAKMIGSPSVDHSTEVRRLLAVFAMSCKPIAPDICLGFRLAADRLSLRVFNDAIERGWLVEAPSGLLFRDESKLDSVLAELTYEDWLALASRGEIVEIGLQSARSAAKQGDEQRARVIYNGLILGQSGHGDRRLRARWLSTVLEALRLYRREANWIAKPIADSALEVARDLGLSGAEAVLLAIDTYERLRRGDFRDAQEQSERALGIAAETDDLSVRRLVRLYVSGTWLLLGRLRDAISLQEAFAGDVPEDMASGASGSLPATLDQAFQACRASLATTYVWCGEKDRGLRILRQMADEDKAGDRRQTRIGAIFLGFVYAELGELALAGKWSQLAVSNLTPSDLESSPAFLVHAIRAWVHMRLGDLEATKKSLRSAVRARSACGNVHSAGHGIFEVLEWLQIKGVAQVEGLSLAAEIESVLSRPNPRMQGIGLRFQARMLSRGSGDKAQIRDLLSQSVERLRGGDAFLELSLVSCDVATLLPEDGLLLANASTAGELDLSRTILELGKLSSFRFGREGALGGILARLCSKLGVWRCAIIELSPEAKVLAARGGDFPWLCGAVEMVERASACGARRICRTDLEQGDERLAIALIPFAIEGTNRRGFLCIEAPSPAPLSVIDDESLLSSLGLQIGIVCGNIAILDELSEARGRLAKENRYYRRSQESDGLDCVGDSDSMKVVRSLVERVSRTVATVLLFGEIGVEKASLAREIHEKSDRRTGPFIAVNISALRSELVASALFGHERGALVGVPEQSRGRFELADGGTLFLDEVGALGAEEQDRLLRVLQEGTYERVGGSQSLRTGFRLVVGTQRDLQAEVKAGRFREDLLGLLHVFPILVPPLRERRSDIPLLAEQFMKRFGDCKRFDRIGDADMGRLLSYSWPGNVRELENIIERSVLLSEPPVLKIASLEHGESRAPERKGKAQEWVSLEECERRYLRKVFAHTEGKLTGADGAAAVLGLNPSTLQFRIDKLGIRSDLVQTRITRAVKALGRDRK